MLQASSGFRCYVLVDDCGRLAVSKVFACRRSADACLQELSGLNAAQLAARVAEHAGVDCVLGQRVVFALYDEDFVN